MKYKEISLKQTIQDIYSTAQYCPDKDYVYWTAKTTPARGKRVVQIMLDYLDPKERVLDVGFSQGLTIGYIAQVFPKVEGADIDKEAAVTARQRLNRLGLKNKLHVYDGKRLPFDDNTFDAITATEVFEHVNDREKFVKELYRVLKKGGTLIITSPNKLYPIECEFHLPFLAYLPKSLADLYVKLSGKGENYDHIDHPFYFQFKNTVEKYFTVKDITFDLIKNYDKYFLNEERGKIVPLTAGILKTIEVFEKLKLSFIVFLPKLFLNNLSAGWVFVAKKR